MKYRAVIWDIDGTLLNTLPGLISSYKYTFEHLGLPQRTVEEITSYIGFTPTTVFLNKFALTQEKAQEASDVFRDRYKKYDLLKAEAYSGISDVLKIIYNSSILQAVATNKRQDYALDICKHFGIDAYCKPIYGADNFNKLTKADLIKKCVDELAVSDVVMIGDTNTDKAAAEQAGVDFIGVNYGFGFKNIAYYADSPKDILKKLGLN